MKPWDELGYEQKMEAIAVRLGWTKDAADWWCSPGNTRQALVLPDWHIQDGLAFLEVWPAVSKVKDNQSPYYIGVNYEGRPAVLYFYYDYDQNTDMVPIAVGDTYAEAITRAAYELLPETPSS
jgi:hypothetical protein